MPSCSMENCGTDRGDYLGSETCAGVLKRGSIVRHQTRAALMERPREIATSDSSLNEQDLHVAVDAAEE